VLLYGLFPSQLKDVGFPRDGRNYETYTDINDNALVERIVHSTLCELIEACPRQLGTATFVLGSANQGPLELHLRGKDSEIRVYFIA
jgi:hypothetical protein